jgi:hypothetical protein
MLQKGVTMLMTIATSQDEIDAIYGRLSPWLERICPRYGVDHAHIASFKDVDALVDPEMSNASGYLVVNGKYSEIGSGAEKTRHLFWPGSCYVVRHREMSIQDIQNATQAVGATHVVLVQYAALQANGIADPKDFNQVIVFEKT